jgi:hypothetical protein
MDRTKAHLQVLQIPSPGKFELLPKLQKIPNIKTAFSSREKKRPYQFFPV